MKFVIIKGRMYLAINTRAIYNAQPYKIMCGLTVS